MEHRWSTGHRGVNSSVSEVLVHCAGAPYRTRMLKKVIIDKSMGVSVATTRPMLVVIAPLTPRESVRLPGVGLFSTKNPPVILINLCTVFAV